MSGNDEKDAEVTFKVADRRKFNADGSLKEGVTLEPTAKEESVKAAESRLPPRRSVRPSTQEVEPETEALTDADYEEVPGADDPASFVNFLSTLATNAAAALGAMPHPATGKRSLDLDTGKYWLDVLGMLRDKDEGQPPYAGGSPARWDSGRSADAVCSDRKGDRRETKATSCGKSFPERIFSAIKNSPRSLHGGSRRTIYRSCDKLFL